jgi:DNA-binding response OmpR family regulator
VGATILVIDDEPQIRRALSAGLRANGFTVELAETGEEALDRDRYDDLWTERRETR